MRASKKLRKELLEGLDPKLARNIDCPKWFRDFGIFACAIMFTYLLVSTVFEGAIHIDKWVQGILWGMYTFSCMVALSVAFFQEKYCL